MTMMNSKKGLAIAKKVRKPSSASHLRSPKSYPQISTPRPPPQRGEAPDDHQRLQRQTGNTITTAESQTTNANAPNKRGRPPELNRQEEQSPTRTRTAISPLKMGPTYNRVDPSGRQTRKKLGQTKSGPPALNQTSQIQSPVRLKTFQNKRESGKGPKARSYSSLSNSPRTSEELLFLGKGLLRTTLTSPTAIDSDR